MTRVVQLSFDPSTPTSSTEPLQAALEGFADEWSLRLGKRIVVTQHEWGGFKFGPEEKTT